MQIQISKQIFFPPLWKHSDAVTKQMVIQMQAVTSSVYYPFECVVNTERHSIIVGCFFPPFYFCIAFIAVFFHLTDESFKRPFLACSHLPYSLTNRPVVIKRYPQLCPQTKHERPAASKEAPSNADRAGVAGQCRGAGEVNNRHWPSPRAPPTLEHQQYNKQQRITEPNIAMPEEVKQQEDKRKRETEKKIEREGDMIGRKTRQRGWGGRQWDKETETEWVKVVDEAAEVWWGRRGGE